MTMPNELPNLDQSIAAHSGAQPVVTVMPKPTEAGSQADHAGNEHGLSSRMLKYAESEAKRRGITVEEMIKEIGQIDARVKKIMPTIDELDALELPESKDWRDDRSWADRDS